MAENATVLDRFDIHPSETAEEHILPLLHFDISFLFFHPIQRILFFQFPCTKPYFLQTVVPKLKKSLAQSLVKFPPLAGKIVVPLSSGRPFSRFTAGDAVPLTVAESDKDFDYLIGNQPRASADFYGCVAQMPPGERSESEAVFPALALQITLFPGRGVSLGFTNDHGIGDANSIVRFIKYWASINKFGDDADVSEVELLPSSDRSAVEDPEGLDSIYWNIIKGSRPIQSPASSIPINKYRSTFVVSKDDVQKLKRFVLERRPTTRATAFTVTCALAWVCLVKAEPPAAATDDDESEFFGFPADCRSRLVPPLPDGYFGNCLAFVKAELPHGTLKGDDGIAAAAESISEAIQKTVFNKKGILDGAETWPLDYGKLIGKRLFGVAGSPRFDLYELDFGWGRPAKYESASIDADTSMSLCKSRDSAGGLEFGLSRQRDVLDAFSAQFQNIIQKL